MGAPIPENVALLRLTSGQPGANERRPVVAGLIGVFLPVTSRPKAATVGRSGQPVRSQRTGNTSPGDLVLPRAGAFSMSAGRVEGVHGERHGPWAEWGQSHLPPPIPQAHPLSVVAPGASRRSK